jgi:hypothetical protein
VRALRRHHYQRLKNKRKRYWDRSVDLEQRELGMVVSTPHPCSCWLCNKQRKRFGPKFSEMKAAERYLTLHRIRCTRY